MKHALIASTFLAWVVYCSSIVDSGRNGFLPEPDASPLPSPTVIEGVEFTPEPSPSLTLNQTEITKKAIVCLADEPIDHSPVEAFCSGFDTSHDDFKHFYEKVCKQGTITNMLVPKCGWHGEGPKRTFLKIVEHTPTENRDMNEFYYFSAFAIVVELSLEKSLQLNRMAYLDAIEFTERFEAPPNSTVLNATEGPSGEITYELQTKAPVFTQFKSVVRQREITPTFYVAEDHSIGSPIGIKLRRNIIFFKEVSPSSTQMVVLTEYLVPSGGLNQVVYQGLFNLDLDFMGMMFRNAQRF